MFWSNWMLAFSLLLWCQPPKCRQLAGGGGAVGAEAAATFGADACVRCKEGDNNAGGKLQQQRFSNKEKQDESSLDSTKEEILDNMTNIRCVSPSDYFIQAIELSTWHFRGVQNSVNLVARILDEFYPRNDERLLRTFLEKLFKSEKGISSGRLIWVGNGSLGSPLFYAEVHRSNATPFIFERQNTVLKDMPWLSKEAKEVLEARGGGQRHRLPREEARERSNNGGGYWSNPYYYCEKRQWLVSYAAFTYADTRTTSKKRQTTTERLVGLISVDIDVSDLNVNQCDVVSWENGSSGQATDSKEILFFAGTHKCHNETSQCIFESGQGWSRGAYKCRCRDGFYSAMGQPVFNGTLVEAAWQDKYAIHSPSYDILFVCKPCQEGCETCVNDDPCLSRYNWAFRISLLTISIICIILTLILMLYVYRFRKLKVIQVASPIFLCITLLGCAIMYGEMAAIFPVLDSYSCVATKWTRHMGFCITYSALLLKTWRVSLTYRVKSAHKLKLTDKQLLHWLFPILLVMAIYLGTWTISSTPVAIYLTDWYHLKFKQCDYNWWDHSLAIGEFLFLLWGIKVCYNVRNAESFFNEAKHITWAVYNITIINLIMLLIHLVILPHAGPDIKYLFGFIRTQMSTTVTTILIFGPKFYRVMKGQGDTWDNRARARGVTASFSLNGVGLMHEETPDLNQENDELKEEIQKLAAQIEFMKIVHMEMNNRHLKAKHGSFFNQANNTQSPIIKSMYMKFESTESPASRISPAAELVSEHV